jgi:hypothetical protein
VVAEADEALLATLGEVAVIPLVDVPAELTVVADVVGFTVIVSEDVATEARVIWEDKLKLLRVGAGTGIGAGAGAGIGIGAGTGAGIGAGIGAISDETANIVTSFEAILAVAT